MDSESDTPTSATSAASSLPSTPVTWQVVIWTTMPLLLNLWAQPTGRVLSLDLRYSKLARCFPILTLFDSLSLLLDILYHRIFIRIHPSLEASMILVKRFSNRTAHTSIYFDKYTRPEFAALRTGRWQQWLLFVLSCLLPAIKLMSLKGIPWTKSVGLVWLFSWIWLEIATLSLLALAKGDDLEDILKVIDSLPKRDYLNTSPISITHRNVSSNKLREIEMVDPFPRFKACSKNINDGLIIAAITVHGFLGFWMLQDISLAGIELESSLPRSLVEAAIVMFIPVCLRLGRSLYSLPPLKLPNSSFSFADMRNREPVGIWIGDRTEETQPSTSFRKAVPVTALIAVYLSVLVFRSWYAPREVGLVILHAALFLAFGAQIWLAGWIVITIYTYIRRLIDGYYFSYMRPGTGDGDRVFWMAMLLLVTLAYVSRGMPSGLTTREQKIRHGRQRLDNNIVLGWLTGFRLTVHSSHSNFTHFSHETGSHLGISTHLSPTKSLQPVFETY